MPMRSSRRRLDKKSVIKVDLSPNPAEDGFISLQHTLKHDPLELRWPLKDCSVTLLSAASVVHRIDPRDGGFLKWMDEAWRVLKYDGQLRIATPYGVNTGFVSDPCAINPCTPQTFHYFDPSQGTNLYAKYKPKPWRILQCFWQVDGLMEILLSKQHEA